MAPFEFEFYSLRQRLTFNEMLKSPQWDVTSIHNDCGNIPMLTNLRNQVGLYGTDVSLSETQTAIQCCDLCPVKECDIFMR